MDSTYFTKFVFFSFFNTETMLKKMPRENNFHCFCSCIYIIRKKKCFFRPLHFFFTTISGNASIGDDACVRCYTPFSFHDLKFDGVSRL